MDPWKPWQPSADEPWDLRRVVHLHRRAAFAATWKEIQRDLEDGPYAAIERLLAGESPVEGAPEDFEKMAGVIGDAAIGSDNVNRLKAWWFYRMLFTPDPLGERLALMWHNHFATSNVKVEDVALMRRQNAVFRACARAPFGEMLRRMVKDPALLLWLDADVNRKERPNENLSREIMELFTLGVGNYTEADIKEAARALTGWTVKDGEFRHSARDHDDGEKTIFQQTGRWNGDDVVRLLLEHPAAARRLANRISELFMGEGAVDQASVDELADGLRERDLDIGWAVATVLHSAAFFSERNLGNRVLAPVEYIVGALRSLEIFDPPPSTLLLAERSSSLGQDLFDPPNVFGWPGGRAWLTSRAIIGRMNFATALVAGALHYPSHPFDAAALAERHGAGRIEEQRVFYSRLLLGRANPPDDLVHHEDTLNRFVSSLLASPEAQLA
jgi:uncharacterized protein (DUF1800 family)